MATRAEMMDNMRRVLESKKSKEEEVLKRNRETSERSEEAVSSITGPMIEGPKAAQRKQAMREMHDELERKRVHETTNIEPIKIDQGNLKSALLVVKNLEDSSGRTIPKDYYPTLGEYWTPPNLEKITELEEKDSTAYKMLMGWEQNKDDFNEALNKMGMSPETAAVTTGLISSVPDLVIGSLLGLADVRTEEAGKGVQFASKYGTLGLELLGAGKGYKVAQKGVRKLLPRLYKALPTYSTSIMSKAARSQAAKRAAKVGGRKALARMMAETSLFSSGWAGAESLLHGEPEKIPESMVEGAVMGAVLPPAMMGIGKGIGKVGAPIVHKFLNKLGVIKDPAEYEKAIKAWTDTEGKIGQLKAGFDSLFKGKAVNPKTKIDMAEAILATGKAVRVPAKIKRKLGRDFFEFTKFRETLENNKPIVEGIVDSIGEGARVEDALSALRKLVKTGETAIPTGTASKVRSKFIQNFWDKHADDIVWNYADRNLYKHGINLGQKGFAEPYKAKIGKWYPGSYFVNRTEKLADLEFATGMPVTQLPMRLYVAKASQMALEGEIVNNTGRFASKAKRDLTQQMQKLGKALKQPGLLTDDIERGGLKMRQYQSQMRALDDIERAGEKYGLEQLRHEAGRVGFGGKEGSKKIFDYMHYVESTPEGVVFNPNKLKIKGKYNIPDFRDIDLPEPNASQMEFLSKVRNFFDMTQTQLPDAGYLARYVPYNLMVGLKQASKASTTVGSAMQREGGKISRFYDRNIWSLLKRQVRDTSSAHTTKPMIAHAQYFSNGLRRMGRGDWAEIVDGAANAAAGVTSREAKQKTMEEVMSWSEKEIAKYISKHEMGLDPSTFEKVATLAKEVTAGSLFGTRLRLNLLQHLQPELVASAEMTPEVIAWAKSNYKNKAFKEMLKQTEKLSLGSTFSLEEALGTEKLTGKWKKVAKYLTFPTKPLKNNFMKGDAKNRKIVQLAGWKHFNDHAPKIQMVNGRAMLPQELSDGLLPQQAKMVTDRLTEGFQKTGKLALDKAAQEYAMIRQFRSNFMYHPIDMPHMFNASGLYQVVPFTTWSRNIWARLISDVKHGQTRTLVNRVAYPIAYLNSLKLLTGIDVPSGHPLSSTTGLPGARLHPALSMFGDMSYTPATVARQVLELGVPPAKMLRQAAKTPEKGFEAWGLRYQPERKKRWEELTTGLTYGR